MCCSIEFTFVCLDQQLSVLIIFPHDTTISPMDMMSSMFFMLGKRATFVSSMLYTWFGNFEKSTSLFIIICVTLVCWFFPHILVHNLYYRQRRSCSTAYIQLWSACFRRKIASMGMVLSSSECQDLNVVCSMRVYTYFLLS
jgi:hypothetical protein